MQLPPGFRFNPTDAELIRYYLKRKLLGKRIAFDAISEVDIYKYAPWDLPGKSRLDGGDSKWYFFCSVNKYGRGVKSNRSTELGYWKSIGKDRPVGCGDRVVGMVKTLVFHLGKTPRGEQTDWVMYEYTIEEKELRDCGAVRDGYLLCAVFKKDGLGPRVGAHYGENDGNEDKENRAEFNGEADSCAALTAPTPLLDSVEAHNYLNSSLNISDNLAVWSMEPHPSEPDACLPLCTPSDYDVALDLPQSAREDDDIILMLDMFGEENTPHLANDLIQVEDRISCRNTCINSASDGVDICFGFEDLENIGPLIDSVYNISGPFSGMDSMDQLHCFNEAQFLELMDLDVPLSFSKEAAQDETLEADNFVDFNNYKNDSKQPCYLPGADATFAASFSGSTTVCDQNGVNKKVDLPCTIADSVTLKLQGESAHGQKSFSRGDHAHSVIFLKNLKDGVVFCHCYGSSTHVKAEVTGCTKDALSDKLEESSFTYVHGCNVVEVEFGKGTASSNIDMFMFIRFCIVLSASITIPLRSMLQESLLIIWFICKGLFACLILHHFTMLMSLLLLDWACVFHFWSVAFFPLTLVAS